MWNALLNAAGAVGNAIDLPGSSVRDALAGRNPLDQWATPLTDKNRTSGRDLLRVRGLAGSKDTWGNFAGGMLTEAALDPLNFIPGMAAVKGISGITARRGLTSPATITSVSSRARAMTPLRRKVTTGMITDDGDLIVKGPAPRHVMEDVYQHADEGNMAGFGGIHRGSPEATPYAVSFDRSALRPDVSGSHRDVQRHEMKHALHYAASQLPRAERASLPLGVRIPASLLASRNPYLNGMGAIATEVSARANATPGIADLLHPANAKKYAEAWRSEGVPLPITSAFRGISAIYRPITLYNSLTPLRKLSLPVMYNAAARTAAQGGRTK